MPVALFALAIGAFGIGLTEFVVAGILPQIARDFGVDPIRHQRIRTKEPQRDRAQSLAAIGHVADARHAGFQARLVAGPVSYTHLTLPTTPYV